MTRDAGTRARCRVTLTHARHRATDQARMTDLMVLTGIKGNGR